MGDFHIAGFEIPIARGAGDFGSDHLGGGGFGVTGTPIGGHIATTESMNVSTTLLTLAEAIALESLCRRNNGVVWHADNTQYSSAGLAFTDTASFSTTNKFGTHSVSISTSAGDFGVCTVGSKYTVAAWTKDGAGDWEHHILRSDGAKWVDATRNDSATLLIEIDTGVLELLDDGSNTRLYDEIVWLPFEIADDWGADWPQAEVFSDLPGLDITGDLLGGYRINDARVRARVRHQGYSASLGSKSAKVDLDIIGTERVVA